MFWKKKLNFRTLGVVLCVLLLVMSSLGCGSEWRKGKGSLLETHTYLFKAPMSNKTVVTGNSGVLEKFVDTSKDPIGSPFKRGSGSGKQD